MQLIHAEPGTASFERVKKLFLAVTLLSFSPMVAALTCPGPAPTPPPEGVCSVTAGDASLLLQGTVLAESDILVNGQVLIDSDGLIACTACDCSSEPGFETATRVECPEGVISPGLIDSDTQLTYSQNPPYTPTGERYEHRHDWRLGLNGHTKITANGGATAAQRQYAELRAVLAGTTSINGRGTASGFARNLDTFLDATALGILPINNEPFPLNDAAGLQLDSTCEYATLPAIDPANTDFFSIAEGIDAFAHNEWLCQSGGQPGAVDVIGERPITRALALNAGDAGLARQRGATLVWSPRHNTAVYGTPGPAGMLAGMELSLSLGSYWLITGSMNLQRELACASDLNEDYFGGVFSDRDLWRMVTYNPAKSFGATGSIGVLGPGRFGDVAIFDGRVNQGYRAVIDAGAQDIVLVLRGGVPLHGDAAIVAELSSGSECDLLPMCGVDKRICVQNEVGTSFSQLQTAAGVSIYPTFFCETPLNEPTCIPSRPAAVNGSSVFTGLSTAGDDDGDGVANAADNCPLVFNPILPMHDGIQADWDDDGVGDECDACPVEPGDQPCLFPIFGDGFEAAG